MIISIIFSTSFIQLAKPGNKHDLADKIRADKDKARHGLQIPGKNQNNDGNSYGYAHHLKPACHRRVGNRHVPLVLFLRFPSHGSFTEQLTRPDTIKKFRSERSPAPEDPVEEPEPVHASPIRTAAILPARKSIPLPSSAPSFSFSWFSLLFVDKNILDAQAEMPGDLKRQQNRRIIAAIFQGSNGLSGNLQISGQIFLFDTPGLRQPLKSISSCFLLVTESLLSIIGL